MNTLTKGQIRQLTPEQQEAIATMEVTRIKKRQKLLACARGSRLALIVFPFLLVVAIFGLSYFKMPFQIILMFLVICIWPLFMVINRRLDAMMELLEDDKIIRDEIRHDDAA
jgi:Zn-dependent protease with chaperone function